MTLPAIRAATRADLPALLALDSALFGPDAWSPAAMAAEVDDADPGRCSVVALLGGSTVGYAAARTAADAADLLRVGVAPGHQRGGVGTTLVQAVVDRARSVGCTRLLLEVACGNSAAVAMYGRLGFEVIATRPRYYAGGADALVMARSLLTTPSDALDEQRHR